MGVGAQLMRASAANDVSAIWRLGGVRIVGDVLERREFGVETHLGCFLIVNRANEKTCVSLTFLCKVESTMMR